MSSRGIAERHGFNLVRFSCERHLARFSVPGPKPGQLAWCARCGEWRTVSMVVTNPNRAVCGKRATWMVSGYVVDVVCTEPRGHEEDKHYDESYSAYFPDKACYRMSQRQRPSRAVPQHGDDVFTTLDP